MAFVVERATAKFKASANTGDFNPTNYIINPDAASQTVCRTVPEHYRKVVGDTVVEMDAGEKATVDTDRETARKAAMPDKLTIKSPDGSNWEIEVTNAGAVTATKV